jgi:RecA-family ATPase
MQPNDAPAPNVPPDNSGLESHTTASTATATIPPRPDTVAQIAAQPHSDSPNLREVYATICSQIIKEQGQIIGILSYEQASLIEGLQVDARTYNCVITGEPLVVLEQLVDKYRQFFGNAAVEVCREAALHLKARLPDEQIPELLRG